MLSGIYQIVGPSGVYVGQSVNTRKRLREHLFALRHRCHYNTHLQRSWNKYGEASFLWETLAFFPVEDLDAAEQVALDSLPVERRFNKALSVVSPSRGLKRSAETREKNKKAAVGNRSHFGCKHSPETVERFSQKAKKEWAQKSASFSRLGKKDSEATKALKSQKQKERWAIKKALAL
jgi:group I intron endonuclease